MTTLTTGGTGKTGSALAHLLHAANYPFLIATRTGKAPEPFKAVTFNWFEESTFENPFKADPNIDRVYLISPYNVIDTLPLVKPFIDLAISRGVKRWVFLTSTVEEPGSPGLGVIHSYPLEKKVDLTVLKPT